MIILGDAGVGKTCLSFRFCNGRFPALTEATIGVDFRERAVVIEDELIRVCALLFLPRIRLALPGAIMGHGRPRALSPVDRRALLP